MPNKLTVLLVDDHALVRRGFRRMLEDEPSFASCWRGQRRTGSRATRRGIASAGDRDGLRPAADERHRGHAPNPRQILPEIAVLMLSMHSEDTLVRQALEAGARGYILKNAMDLDLVAAIKKVAEGKTVLDPQITRTGGSARVNAIPA